MTLYRVSLVAGDGATVTSRTEHSLTDAAVTAIALANSAFADANAALDVDGGANIRVTGHEGRELTPAEKDRMRALLEEHGASRAHSGDDTERWLIV